jgi:hypothetical protein
MKKITVTICALMLSACFLQVNAQTDEEKRWMDYMTPAEVHKMMASWDGEWNEEVSFWMAPNAPAQKMQATCVNAMILGGRYQESKHKGDFSGMPFEGVGTLAYDKVQKMFVNTWIDNMGTGVMVLKGTWDEKTKTINLKGDMTDPMSGKVVQVREVVKIIDENTQVMEQYGFDHDGKEFKTMEIKMTRVKK